MAKDNKAGIMVVLLLLCCCCCLVASVVGYGYHIRDKKEEDHNAVDELLWPLVEALGWDESDDDTPSPSPDPSSTDPSSTDPSSTTDPLAPADCTYTAGQLSPSVEDIEADPLMVCRLRYRYGDVSSEHQPQYMTYDVLSPARGTGAACTQQPALTSYGVNNIYRKECQIDGGACTNNSNCELFHVCHQNFCRPECTEGEWTNTSEARSNAEIDADDTIACNAIVDQPQKNDYVSNAFNVPCPAAQTRTFPYQKTCPDVARPPKECIGPVGASDSDAFGHYRRYWCYSSDDTCRVRNNEYHCDD